jgi:hypothetical protein
MHVQQLSWSGVLLRQYEVLEGDGDGVLSL